MALTIMQVLASVCQRIYSVQKIRLINSKSCKMKDERSVLIPAITERWGRRKNKHYHHKDKSFTFGWFSLWQLSCDSLRIQYRQLWMQRYFSREHGRDPLGSSEQAPSKGNKQVATAVSVLLCYYMFPTPICPHCTGRTLWRDTQWLASSFL